MLKIFCNFIPNIVCGDPDPSCMNDKIKSLTKKKSAFYRSQRQSVRFDSITSDAMTLEVPKTVSVSKLKYYERLATNLSDSQTSPKTCWSILKKISNGTKIPFITPLLGNHKFTTDFRSYS